MPGFVARSVNRAASRLPLVRRVPVMKLLAAAEVAMITREHVARLNRDERRRVLELIRIGRGRRRNLTPAERHELALLIARMEPRALAMEAAEKFSVVPLPRRFRERQS